MPGERKVLTDHDEIRAWAEERSATPSQVASTATEDDVGIIRLDFPGYTGEGTLEAIEWDQWFEKFDENELALIVQQTTAEGEPSNFNKLVKRSTVEEGGAKPRGKKTRGRPAAG